MPSGLRYRFWLESGLSLITGTLAIVTLFWHDWIETVFGNGSAEWLVVFIALLITAALAVGARHEWRRAQLAAS